MTTHDTERIGTARAIFAGPTWGLVLSAVGFLALYLSVDFVSASLASSSLPLPNAPAEQARRWFAENPTAAVVTGVLQLLSVLSLGAFVLLLRTAAVTASQHTAARRATPWGLAAVGLMASSSGLSCALAGLGADASLGTVSALRTANFVTGGTAHVLALGIFVLLASRMPGFGKAVRVFGVVAAVPAILSLVSLAWFPGAVFILLGRLLCMIWTITAAVSAARRTRRTGRAE